MGAVLVALLLIGVGFDVYGVEVKDLTDISGFSLNIRERLGLLPGLESPEGNTTVSADLNYGEGNFSQFSHTAPIEKIVVEGEGMNTTFGGFNLNEYAYEVENFTGRLLVGQEEVSINGEASTLRVGGSSLESEEPKELFIEGEPDVLELENITNTDFDFDNVSGEVRRGSQTHSLESTPLKFESFSGMFKRDLRDSEVFFEGVVVEGSFGSENSRTYFGN